MKSHLQFICQQLKAKIQDDKDRISADRRTMLAQLPKFLDALKNEVVNEDSPIWDPSFKPPGKISIFKYRRKVISHPALSCLTASKKTRT